MTSLPCLTDYRKQAPLPSSSSSMLTYLSFALQNFLTPITMGSKKIRNGFYTDQYKTS
jgi:hypothetical protein